MTGLLVDAIFSPNRQGQAEFASRPAAGIFMNNLPLPERGFVFCRVS
jgi:hypothetical protein